MNNKFRKQTIFDRWTIHKELISDPIDVSMFGYESYIRKITLTDSITISVPKEFVSVYDMYKGACFDFNDVDIPVDNNELDINNITIAFINLDPRIINITDPEFKDFYNNLYYNRKFDDFIIGNASNVILSISNGKIKELRYTFCFESDHLSKSYRESTYWIYEDGIYMN